MPRIGFASDQVTYVARLMSQSCLESPYTVAAIEQTPHPTDCVESERQVEWVGQLHHPRQLKRAPAGLCHSLQEQSTEAIAPRAAWHPFPPKWQGEPGGCSVLSQITLPR